MYAQALHSPLSKKLMHLQYMKFIIANILQQSVNYAEVKLLYRRSITWNNRTRP